jgi:hypothetical protein
MTVTGVSVCPSATDCDEPVVTVDVAAEGAEAWNVMVGMVERGMVSVESVAVSVIVSGAVSVTWNMATPEEFVTSDPVPELGSPTVTVLPALPV